MKYLLDIDTTKWRLFISACKAKGTTAAFELRKFIDSFINKHSK